MGRHVETEIYVGSVILFLVVGFMFGYVHGTVTEQTVCRHSIQRAFLKTRAEAEKIIAEQREQE